MYHIITNPSSGSGKNADNRLLSELESSLTRAGIDYEIIYTSGPGHAAALGRTLSRTGSEETVLILGGDGTINEFLSEISEPSHIRLGILPAGSGNDLARGLGLPDLRNDPEQKETIARITAGNVCRTVDLGVLEFSAAGNAQEGPSGLSGLRSEKDPSNVRRLFIISSGIGFDAAVCAESLRSGEKDFFNRLHLGKLTYGYLALKHLASYFSHKTGCRLLLDGTKQLHLRHFLFAAAMNHSYEGGGYCFAPDASDTDGMLNLLVIGDMPILRLFRSFPAAHAGKHYRIKGVRHYTFRRAVIRSTEPLWVHVDGEVPVKTDRISYSILPQALKLIV
ncbi:MAG: diacylglycerol kinase family protein [Eubacteriales bacterium]|nr:diacylglycerol kinase family protein [Eubacteriales bacterium]